MAVPLDRMAHQLDWNLLRTFVVIVQEGGITAASERLNLSQPTVSAALRRLEERLDHRLIDRGGSSTFKVTDAGETLYRESVEIYGSITRLMGEIGQAAQSVSGSVTVYHSNHLELSDLLAVATDFQRANPRMTIIVRTASCEDVSQAVTLKRATIGFASWSDPAAGLLRHDLYQEPHRAYCGAGHALFGQATAPAEDLASADLVLMDGDRVGGPLEELAAYRMHVGLRGRVAGQANDPQALLRLIETGLGVGLLPTRMGERFAETLWPIPIGEPEPATPVAAILNPQVHFESGERAFLRHLFAADLCPPDWRTEIER